MAINAYTGLPRSGKSYGVVENVIVPALQKGRCVWTNIPINEEKMAAFAGCIPTQFNVADIKANPRWFQDVLPKGAVLILDEAWRVWPSGLKATNISEDHKSFFAEHGHMVGEDNFVTEIYLVTQDLAQLAAFIRQLIDTTYRASKLSAIGANKKFRVDIYDGAVTGQKPPASKIVRKIYGSYKKDIYALYQSHTMSDTGAAGDETSSDSRKNIFKGMGAKAILLTAVTGIAFSIYGLNKVRDYYAPKQSAVAKTESPSSGQIVRPLPPPREKGFLDGRKISIVSNLDYGAGEQFVFRVEEGDSFSRVEAHDLTELGYSITKVNDCLAVVRGFDQRYFVQCKSEQHQREGLNLVSATTDAVKSGS